MATTTASAQRILQRLAERLIRLRPSEVEFDLSQPGHAGAFRELFDHPAYLASPPERRRDIAIGWAQQVYDVEREYPFDAVFGVDLSRFCADAKVLDLGCYIGGRTVRWLERYGAREIHGVDIDARFIDVAEAFAERRSARAHFHLGVGESLPFESETFDAILTQDTFEHVQDLGRVLAECRRVLRPGGRLALSFPPFYAPLAHHLDLATRTPAVHWMIPYPTLLRAYFRVLDDRGASAAWYRREEREPLPHERGYSINGTTAGRFRRLIADGWEVEVDAFRDRRSRSDRRAVRWLVDGAKRTDLRLLRELIDVAYVLRRR